MTGKPHFFITVSRTVDVIELSCRLSDPSITKYWMGYRRGCAWADGTQLEDDAFYNWTSTETGGSTHMRIKNTGVWKSLDDSNLRRYICEKPGKHNDIVYLL